MRENIALYFVAKRLMALGTQREEIDKRAAEMLVAWRAKQQPPIGGLLATHQTTSEPETERRHSDLLSDDGPSPEKQTIDTLPLPGGSSSMDFAPWCASTDF